MVYNKPPVMPTPKSTTIKLVKSRPASFTFCDVETPVSSLRIDTCFLLSSFAFWGSGPCVQKVFWANPRTVLGCIVVFCSSSLHLKGWVFQQAVVSLKCGNNSGWPRGRWSFSACCTTRRKAQIIFTNTEASELQLGKLRNPHTQADKTWNQLITSHSVLGGYKDKKSLREVRDTFPFFSWVKMPCLPPYWHSHLARHAFAKQPGKHQTSWEPQFKAFTVSCATIDRKAG